MKEIKLTQGQVTLVDDGDFEDLNRWKWYASKDLARAEGGQFDARRMIRIDGKRRSLYMHRYLMNPTKDQQVDHIDGNPLNNQKSNLRLCAAYQNQHNVGKRRDNLSGHKGVHWHHKNNKWVAQITVHGKQTHLGYFEGILDAAKAYEDAVKEHFGEFVRK